jgi:hypothetical protein
MLDPFPRTKGGRDIGRRLRAGRKQWKYRQRGQKARAQPTPHPNNPPADIAPFCL